MQPPALPIHAIRKTCSDLFKTLGFQVYARIDGFFTSSCQVYLNDPNTTAGMNPSSFLFHPNSQSQDFQFFHFATIPAHCCCICIIIHDCSNLKHSIFVAVCWFFFCLQCLSCFLLKSWVPNYCFLLVFHHQKQMNISGTYSARAFVVQQQCEVNSHPCCSGS